MKNKVKMVCQKSLISSSKWLTYSVFSMAIAIILLVMSQTILKDIVTVYTDSQSNNSTYLSFNTSYAKVGSPLIVSIHNADYDPNSIRYVWTVDGRVINNDSNTFIPATNDLEKFISVKVTYNETESISTSIYCSKLPVIYISTDGSSISTTGEDAHINMQGSPFYSYDSTQLYNGDASIKSENSSTRNNNKDNYTISLNKSCNMLDMGNGKNWLLLSKNIDSSLIRSKLMYDLSSKLNMKNTKEMMHVVLIHNNTYKGIYLLSEPTIIDETKVDIYDWEHLALKAAELIVAAKKETSIINDVTADFIETELAYALMADLSWLSSPYKFTYQNATYDMRKYGDIPNLTGGFILSLDNSIKRTKSPIITNYQQPFVIFEPENAATNEELYNYINKYIQTFEYALHSPDFIYRNNDNHYSGTGLYYDWNTGWVRQQSLVKYNDTDRENIHYSSIIQLDSLVDNWILCELSMNYRAMNHDLYIAKDLDALGYICTLQDFDSAFGNKNVPSTDIYFPEEWQTCLNYFTIDNYSQSEQWNRYLIKDPYFLLKVYERYNTIRPTLIEDMIKKGGSIDQYKSYLYEASLRDNKELNVQSTTAAIDDLYHFIATRILWLDAQFASFDTLINSLGAYQASNNISVKSITENNDGTYTITASTNDIKVCAITFLINGTNVLTAKVTNGIATVTTDKINNTMTNIVVLLGKDTTNDYISKLTNYRLFGGEYDNK